MAAFVVGAMFNIYYTTMGVIGIANDDRVQAYEWVISDISPNESVEISSAYSLNTPPGFSGISKLPHYHVKPTFIRWV